MRLAPALVAALMMPVGTWAQDAATDPEAPGPAVTVAPALPPVLVVNQDALFEQSAYGRAAQSRLEAASAALVAENREIEAALEAEERSLTDRRATLPPDEFRSLAEAFNVKVEGIRKAQDTKSRSITRARDEDRQRFFQAAVPVLADILRESGGLVILDQSQVVLSLDRIDVTDEAIRRLDVQIGTGILSSDPDQPPAP
jgi:Skp family chaperone for outer membrane proteins